MIKRTKYFFLISLFAQLFLIPQSISSADSINLNDRELPVLERITLSQSSINTTSADQKVLVTVVASDNLNNISYVPIWVPNKSNLTGGSSTPISVALVAGRVVATFQITLTIPKGWPAGELSYLIRIDDANGNQHVYGSSFGVSGDSYPSGVTPVVLQVTNSGPTNTIDVTQFDITSQLKTLQNSFELLTQSSKALQNANDGLALEKKDLLKTADDLRAKVVDSTKQIEILNLQLTEARSKIQSFSEIEVKSKTLSQELAVANNKIKKICNTKPKPKGC